MKLLFMNNSTQLKIKKSIIGQPGRARISEHMFDELGLKEHGDLLVVERNSRTILVEAYADILVEEGYIRVRWNDLNKLDALEEDTVNICPYKPITRKIKKRVKKIIS